MEQMLHYIWKNQLYNFKELKTTQGKTVEIIDPGLQNTNAGPDFFNAKIKIDQILWIGNIEIHTKSSDWYTHRHDNDPAYENIILHVVEKANKTISYSNGNDIPQMELPVPNSVRKSIEWLLHQETPLPCFERLKEIDSFHISLWKDALLSERLERKTNDIIKLLERYNNDWNEVFYITLCRNFGFGLNSDAFEQLAHKLPLKYIQKQRGSSSQVEALFLGQAGMLEDSKSIDEYHSLLQREYHFLKHKFELKPLSKSLFKSFRVRPDGFPHIRLAQLATIWLQYDTLFSILLEAGNITQIKERLKISPSVYWHTHYQFGKLSSVKRKTISDRTLNLLLINTVVPMFFAYGKELDRPEYCERAIKILERLPAEQNSIIKLFIRAGIKVNNAADTQSLIQLKRTYCEQKKCIYCRIGFRILKKGLNK